MRLEKKINNQQFESQFRIEHENINKRFVPLLTGETNINSIIVRLARQVTNKPCIIEWSGGGRAQHTL